MKIGCAKRGPGLMPKKSQGLASPKLLVFACLSPPPISRPPPLAPEASGPGEGREAPGLRPKAHGPRPRAQGPRRRAHGPRPRAQGPGPKAQGPGPNGQGPFEPKWGSWGPGDPLGWITLPAEMRPHVGMILWDQGGSIPRIKISKSPIGDLYTTIFDPIYDFF